MAKMTRAFVESAPLPKDDKLRVLYWDGGKGALPGFGLSVTKNGVRSYIAQARVNGKTRRMTIGQHSERLTFELAKAKAKAYLLQMDNGIDPREEERRDEAVKTTLRETLEDYLLNHRTGHGKPLRASTQTDMRRHVEQNLADLADEPIANITRNVCLERFNDMTEEGLTGQSNQCMVTVRALCNYAREKHATPDGTYTILAVNPVTMAFGKHKLGKMHKIKPRDSRIPADRIGAVWSTLQKRRAEARTVDDRTSTDYVCMLMLTGLRAGECARLLWENVNLDEGWFRIIEDDAKNHNEVRLPMSSVLRRMLDQRQEAADAPERVARRRADQEARAASPYVFASWGVKSGHITEAKGTMARVSEVAGVPIKRHDLRRSFEDAATACRVSDDQRRQLLNHLASDVHGQSYANNPDPKVLAAGVEAVAQWILNRSAETEAANVVALPARRA